jgi:hypothetical protein
LTVKAIKATAETALFVSIQFFEMSAQKFLPFSLSKGIEPF